MAALEDRGWVSLKMDPTDSTGYWWTVALTDAGAHILEAIERP